jgi:hypothetical protein
MVFLRRVRAANRKALTAVAVTGLLGAALATGPALFQSSPAYASSTPCGNHGTFTFTSSTLTCTYWRPGSDSFTVPFGVTRVATDTNGAQGGSATGDDVPGGQGGQGGWGALASAAFAVAPGEVVQVDTGGVGGTGYVEGSAGTGGVGGGGPGGSGGWGSIFVGNPGGGGGGGGGASDVRAGSCAATLSCRPSAAIIAAGGGGGGGGYAGPDADGQSPGGSGAGGAGGAGGGVQGGNGNNGTGLSGNGFGGFGSAEPPGGRAGAGGPQRGGGGNGLAGTPGSGGSGGAGGSGGSTGILGAAGDGGGGGGGGYFGGGGAGGGGGVGSLILDEGTGGGGGGGSSWIAPSATAGTTVIDPGVQQGNGFVTVTWEAQPLTLVTQAGQDGRSINDVATLTGGYSPTGTITFDLYGPDDTSCTTPIAMSGATVTGDGTYTSASYTATAPGTYTWEASYNGNSNNAPAKEGCGVPSETVTFAKGVPTLVTQATEDGAPDNHAIVGNYIGDNATLTGGSSPDGTITFNLYGPGDASCTSPIATYSATVNGNGTYVSAPSYQTTLAGSYRWVADYSGDGFNDPVAPESCGLGSETVTVAKTTPTLVSTASGGSPTLDSPISDSASLNGGSDPTGSITFALYANNSCAGSPVLSSSAVPVSGNGTYSSGNLPAPDPSTYYWVATYSGDQNNNSVATSCGAGPITVQLVRA